MRKINPPLSRYEVDNYARHGLHNISPDINIKPFAQIAKVDGGVMIYDLAKDIYISGNNPLEPIPLNREILFYSKFRETGTKYFELNGMVLEFDTHRLEKAILYKDNDEDGEAYEVINVHELQNAWYMLTGEKLEIMF